MDKKTTKNEEIKNPTFHEKLVSSVNTFAGFKKDSKNPFFKSNYMSLDLICSVITPVLSDNGLYATSYIEGENLVTKVTDGTDSISSSWKLSNSVKPQERGAEMTYARRYNLSALLNISVDLDTDGNDINGEIEVTDEIVRTPISQPISLDEAIPNMKDSEWLDAIDSSTDIVKDWTGAPDQVKVQFITEFLQKTKDNSELNEMFSSLDSKSKTALKTFFTTRKSELNK